MDQLSLSLIVIFIAITIIPTVAKRLRLPVIVTEILFGIIIGKSLINMVPKHDVIEFLSSFGLAFLMFLVGLEINFDEVKRHLFRTIFITAFSIAGPFYVGYRLAPEIEFEYPYLLGTIFSTTSLGLVLPITRELKFRQAFLHTLLGSVVLVDILSMFLLGFSITLAQQPTIGESFYYSTAAVLVLFFLPALVSRKEIQQRINAWFSEESHAEVEMRLAFAMILVLGALAEEFKYHSVIGAFIAGLIISECTETAPELRGKLEGIGYGFFIPLLFIIIGAKVDLVALFGNLTNIALLFVIIVAAILSKTIGVGIGSLLSGLGARESLAMGLLHSARLSLIIAAVEIARKMELMSESLFSTFVLLAITSAVIGPSIAKNLLPAAKEIDELEEILPGESVEPTRIYEIFE